jgi:predicted Rdx family selenoprotein
VPGSGGVFDVHADGELIFSRKAQPDRRFPETAEIIALLREREDT